MVGDFCFVSFAGLILSGEKGEDCHLSFLTDDGLEVFSIESNEEIVDLVSRFEPSVIAVDVGSRESLDEFTEEEKDLRDEGFVFTPNSQAKTKVRRLDLLQRQVLDEMSDGGPEFIRFEPYITAEELSLHSDDGLESLGIETENIKSSKGFDSVLGAVTSRFYSEGEFEDKGVIIPESL